MVDLSEAGQALLGRIEGGTATVGVVGLGYVGLPLALGLAEGGLGTVGFDVDPGRVASVMEGRSYIEDIPSHRLAAAVSSGSLRASTENEVLAGVDAVIICVPTPLRKTRDPDTSFIAEAVEMIKGTLHPGLLVILESTSYPGTTREVILPELESKGFSVGTDIFLAFSPERIDPGNTKWGLANTPKIVGGITPSCTRLAAALYRRVASSVRTVSGAESAEMVKLLENTFRAVNIALVNEMAMMCSRLGLDVWEIIAAAATKPFGFMAFKPGPGLGGHCIPVDPHYLSWKLRSLNYTARFVELAGEINSHMPEYVVSRLIAPALNSRGKALMGSRIVVLGVAYKRDVSDIRESPALDIISLALAQGSAVSYCDPHVPELKVEGARLVAAPLTGELLDLADCVVVVTDHSDFDWELVGRKSKLVVDTRNALAEAGIEDPGRIIKL